MVIGDLEELLLEVENPSIQGPFELALLELQYEKERPKQRLYHSQVDDQLTHSGTRGDQDT